MNELIGDYLSLKNCKHGRFLFSRNDQYIGRSLDVYGEWCEAEIRLLDAFIKPGMFIIDVGANIGTHTIYFAKKVGAKGYVMAVEPQRLIYQILNANIAVNELLNVDALQVALADVRGVVELPIIDPHQESNAGGLSLVEDRRFASIGQSRVQLITLDSLSLPACHLIKIDVEGAEARVVKGAMQLIKLHQPFLFIECKPSAESVELIRLLLELKYQLYWHIWPYFNPDNYFKVSENIFYNIKPESNLFCIPAGHSIDLQLEPVQDENDDWMKAMDRINKRLADIKRS